jgi:ADP-ribose pyrophosphatase YjhB (NUDIX family)
VDYKYDLKMKIPEGILQFCEVCVVDQNLQVVLWKTMSPQDNLLETVYGSIQHLNPSIRFLGVLNDQDSSSREARVILVFQDRDRIQAAETDILYPTSFDNVKLNLLDLDPLLPFIERNLECDSSGIEYWRRCRKYIGHDHLFGPAAGAMVTDGKGRYLLQRRSDDGTWGILGGGTEIGESIVGNASREVFEESGLEIRIIRLLSIATGDDCTGEYPNGDKGKFWGFLFLGEVTGGSQIESNEETLELKWFTYEEIEKLENKSLYLANNFNNAKNADLKILAKVIKKIS